MIGANKILTVSYGTFSCTLEGFDDPFNTMKAIAEYFRDLAAEDRYFGAEPPQPDAAMLHRIAEREIQRRVEARVQDNGVILRAETEATPVALAPAAEPAPAAASAAPARPEGVEARPAPAVLSEPQAVSVVESVAAKLSRLRAAQAASAAVVAEVAEAEPATEAAEALLPEASLAGFLAEVMPAPAEAELTAEAPVAAAEPPVAETAETVPAADAEAEAEAALIAALAAAEAAPPPEALPVDLADELSEDAARALSDALSGAPIGRPAAAAAPAFVDEIFPEAEAMEEDPADVLPEDMPAATAELTPEGDLAPVSEAAEPTVEIAAAVEIVEEPAVETLAAPEALDSAAPVETLDAVEPEPVLEAIAEAVAVEAEPAPAEVVEPPALDGDLAALIATLTGDTETTVVSPANEPEAAVETEEPVQATTEPVAEPVAEVADQPETAPEEPARPEAVEKIQRARARVIRIRRPDAPTPVAEVEATVAPEVPAVAAAEPQAEHGPEAAPAEPRRKLEAGADDAALNRLIAQTNTEMEGPEAKRRLSAIAHLKAAVAATVAERLSRGKSATPSEATRAEPYREDLARTVRPTRPEAPQRADRPAPLVLVSEQRIDRPAPTPAPVVAPAPVAAQAVTPVRPRRVTSSALAMQTALNAEADGDDDDEDGDEDPSNVFADTRGFVEFAERLGVRSLPDLMEAAAAYTASVEGRPHFSRPHLVKHLAAARGGEMTREDSLRVFGRLLREGRIEKVKRGQFAVAETSRFLPEARKLGT